MQVVSWVILITTLKGKISTYDLYTNQLVVRRLVLQVKEIGESDDTMGSRGQPMANFTVNMFSY